ncbi:hypothetical protein R3P38DRAFT_1037082 [Favolaschia claudopus]|uniref:Uncharacterized protein n=1 Tax=Favolaschia claudopus TaxID=2862362 RepID=A0AAW0BK86_9AGAR
MFADIPCLFGCCDNHTSLVCAEMAPSRLQSPWEKVNLISAPPMHPHILVIFQIQIDPEKAQCRLHSQRGRHLLRLVPTYVHVLLTLWHRTTAGGGITHRRCSQVVSLLGGIHDLPEAPMLSIPAAIRASAAGALLRRCGAPPSSRPEAHAGMNRGGGGGGNNGIVCASRLRRHFAAVEGEDLSRRSCCGSILPLPTPLSASSISRPLR